MRARGEGKQEKHGSRKEREGLGINKQINK